MYFDVCENNDYNYIVNVSPAKIIFFQNLFSITCLPSFRHAAGAIYSASGNIFFNGSGSHFEQNHAENDGGAISIVAPYYVAMFRVRFTMNTAGNRGGAMYIDSANTNSVVEYQSCGFDTNNATNGGAIYSNAEQGTLFVRGSSFNGNYASENGLISIVTSTLGVHSRPAIVHRKSQMSAGMCTILYPSPYEIWAEDGHTPPSCCPYL